MVMVVVMVAVAVVAVVMVAVVMRGGDGATFKLRQYSDKDSRVAAQ